MDAKGVVLAVLDELGYATVARVHKLVFLAVVEGGIEAGVSFKPHLFGPLSPEVQRALEELVAEGLATLETTPQAGDSYAMKVYRITEKGRREVRRFAETGREELRGLRRIVGRFGCMPLSLVVAYIYYNYPEYTELSIARKSEKSCAL